ncbi:hypothetical protein C8K44_12817 [Aminobacter sp. AP02]|nr:hypothetical protein C8K44_12817 [Aminobacter sp. AP02]
MRQLDIAFYIRASMRKGPLRVKAAAKMSANCSMVSTRAASTPHTARKQAPVEFGVVEIEHTTRIAAEIVDANISHLVLQDCICAIGEDNGYNVELFARLGPKPLERVHAASVSLQCYDFAFRASDGRTRRKRNADSDRAACQRNVVMGNKLRRQHRHLAGGSDRFFTDDGVFGQPPSNRDGDTFGIEHACWGGNVGLAQSVGHEGRVGTQTSYLGFIHIVSIRLWISQFVNAS